MRSLFSSPVRPDGSQKWVDFANARTLFPLVPKSSITKLLVREAITQLNTISHTAEVFRAEMNCPAAQILEYETVMAMTGIDPGRGDLGSNGSIKGKTSKRGSPHLRKTLFVIMSILPN